MNLTPRFIADRTTWQAAIRQFPTAHILQTWAWGEFKHATTGWTAERFLLLDSAENPVAAVSILTRKLGFVQVIYAPKAPLLMDDTPEVAKAVLAFLAEFAKKRRAIWFKIDPDIVLGRGLPTDSPYQDADRPHIPNPNGESITAWLKQNGWRFSDDQVQFRNTFYLDLTATEDELLAGMSQSTRRKIRQADKAGVVVREATSAEDWRRLYDIYAVTGDRQGFLIRPWDYYQQLWRSFYDAGLAYILIAEVEGQAVGGVVLFHFGQRVWYFYGMSSNEHRDYQANYALQWTAIRWAKKQGYHLYDWWGAPNSFQEDDPMWGVYRFKDGFGGDVVRHIGAWDYTPLPPLYWAYTQLMPRIMRFIRRLR